METETKYLIASATIAIEAPIEKVWDALINPETIKKYMFETTVISDWKQGSGITWKGEWEGKSYEDKGVILQLIPHVKLQYTHYFPLIRGLELKPENYHTVTIDLVDKVENVLVSLSQDNNRTEEDRSHSEKNWKMMLSGLKKLLEEK